MRRTLLISEIFPPKHGGSGRWFWESYRRLPSANVVIAAGEHPDQVAFDNTHAMRLYRLPLSMSQWALRSFAGLRGYTRALIALWRVVRTEKIEAIHAARNLPEGFLAWLLRKWTGIPYLCYVHGEDVKTARLSRELTWMTRFILGEAEMVIANSQNSCDILKTEWQLEDNRIHVLYPGVDTKRFAPVPPNEEARARLGWRSRTVLLTVGRLQRRKGQDQLIRALTTIRQSIPNVLYSIIGDGDDRTHLENLTKELGLCSCVQFQGEIRDAELIECYQQCDLFALPNRTVGSDIEGFGMVLLEAQACGKVVVAGNSGGTAETMVVAKTGLIVDCGTPEPLARAIVELLLDPQALERMGDAARRWAVERFDWQSLTEQAAGIFAELGSRKEGGDRPWPSATKSGANSPR
jgi:phosphatidylinositol alpha-1,6-mannosyltransferase